MEDEDRYMSIDPTKMDFYATSLPKETEDSTGASWNSLCWKIVFGISVTGNIALIIAVIFLSISPPGKIIYRNNKGETSRSQIPSCLLNCIPCRSATDSITANLTLDPDTSFPHLYLSEDLKSVKWKGMKQNLKPALTRYDVMSSVLSHEGFTTGKICWEVEVVEGGKWWGVGVVRESANRNGPIYLAPGGGYWGVQRIDGQYQAITDPRTNLTLCHPPTRIRVSLDYSEGEVAFFDGDTKEKIFAFPKIKFSGEKIHAWFLIHGWNGELMIHP